MRNRSVIGACLSALAFWVAQGAGYFADEGLQLDVAPSGTGDEEGALKSKANAANRVLLGELGRAVRTKSRRVRE